MYIILGLSLTDLAQKNAQLVGGFGGKETRTVPHTALCAIASRISNSPVKLTLDRNIDMSITGQRHAFCAKYRASSYLVEGRRIFGGLKCELFNNAGCSLDLSGPVSSDS